MTHLFQDPRTVPSSQGRNGRDRGRGKADPWPWPPPCKTRPWAEREAELPAPQHACAPYGSHARPEAHAGTSGSWTPSHTWENGPRDGPWSRRGGAQQQEGLTTAGLTTAPAASALVLRPGLSTAPYPVLPPDPTALLFFWKPSLKPYIQLPGPAAYLWCVPPPLTTGWPHGPTACGHPFYPVRPPWPALRPVSLWFPSPMP